MENEIWKPVKGYENLYEVSNNGAVKTLPRTIEVSCHKNFTRLHPISAKLKIPRIGKNGYMTVALIRENKTYNTYLHRIIGEAFIKKPDGSNVINHKNGIKTDNRLDNLEWVTSSINNQHAIDTRLRKPAKACIDESIALKINEMKAQKYSNEKVAKILGLSEYSVAQFANGKSYKYLNVKACQVS